MSASEILDYINDNVLPCVALIDATNSSNIEIIGSNYTLKNLFNNDSDYDFIQNTTLNHPNYVAKSITFTGTKHLTIRNNPFNEDTTSYTLILATKNIDFTENQLIQLNKNSSSLPALLEYIYQPNSLTQQFSLSNVKSELEIVNSFSTDLKIGVSHNILYGVTDININNDVTNSYLNLDLGYLNNSELNDLYLGNNSALNKSFIQKFRFLLLFIPAISNEDITSILNLIPLSDVTWDEIDFNFWDNISTDNWNNLD